MKKNILNKNNKKGFTLIEMIVSVFIFSIVMTVAAGSILSIMQSNKKAQSLKAVMNNMNLSLESIVKDIKFSTGSFNVYNRIYMFTGTEMYDDSECPNNLSCTFHLGDDPNSGIYLTLELITGTLDEYQFIIFKEDAGTGLMKKNYISADDISIDYLNFELLSTNGAGGNGDTVTVNLSGIAGKSETATDFSLQTTINRLIPVQE